MKGLLIYGFLIFLVIESCKEVAVLEVPKNPKKCRVVKISNDNNYVNKYFYDIEGRLSKIHRFSPFFLNDTLQIEYDNLGRVRLAGYGDNKYYIFSYSQDFVEIQLTLDHAVLFYQYYLKSNAEPMQVDSLVYYVNQGGSIFSQNHQIFHYSNGNVDTSWEYLDTNRDNKLDLYAIHQFEYDDKVNPFYDQGQLFIGMICNLYRNFSPTHFSKNNPIREYSQYKNTLANGKVAYRYNEDGYISKAELIYSGTIGLDGNATYNYDCE